MNNARADKAAVIVKLKEFAAQVFPDAVVYDEPRDHESSWWASIYVTGATPESFHRIAVKSSEHAPLDGSEYRPFRHECFISNPQFQTYDGMLNEWVQDQYYLHGDYRNHMGLSIDEVRTWAAKSAATVRQIRETRELRKRTAEAEPRVKAAAQGKAEVKAQWEGGFAVQPKARYFATEAEALAYINTLED